MYVCMCVCVCACVVRVMVRVMLMLMLRVMMTKQYLDGQEWTWILSYIKRERFPLYSRGGTNATFAN